MSDLLWQRLVNLKPALPRQVHIQPRYYGDQLWYVLEDRASGKFHRFNTLAYQLLGFMDGHNNLQQIVESAAQASLRQTLEDTPTREDLIELLQYLYVADLLICEFPPQTANIFERQQKKKQQFWHQLIKSPYAWKIPLFNPDRFLQSLTPWSRWMTRRGMAIVWLITIGYALLLAASHWPELSSTQLTDILTPYNLFLLWLTYPLLKAVHELGHGLFTTVWGGRVHEFGVVFIMGTPFPYVDATAATGFSSKAQRVMVGAAGMAVELFLASLALFFWLHTEPGVLRDILFNIVLIGSISTLFFNGNPLMRYDGYHILCDIIDQPNLATRAALQLQYLGRRYGYGLTDSYSPAESRAESLGLGFYAIAAFCYRLLILTSIVLVVARHFPGLGLFFAVWFTLFQFALPVARMLHQLATSDSLANHRKRAILTVGGITILIAAAFFVIPLPQSTHAQGIVWLPEQARIRALASGEVSDVLVKDGEHVEKGDALLHLANIDITASLLQKQATLKEYRSRYEQAWSLDRAQIQLFEQDIAAIELEIAYLQQQVNNLIVRSSSAGTIKLLQQHQLEGSYIKQGDTIGLLITEQEPRVRVVLTQEEVEDVQSRSRAILLRSRDKPSELLEGKIVQKVPNATNELPSAALGTAGGGRITVTANNNTRTTEQVFLLDISIPDYDGLRFFGQRVDVKFQHPSAPLAFQLSRGVRQLVVRLLRDEA